MKTLVFALALVAATWAGGWSAAEPEDPLATPVATSANSALVEDITRLWTANLSEEFIEKYVARSELAQDLTAEDVVRLRNAGVPETLITSITRRRTEAGAAATAPGMPPGPRDSRRWDWSDAKEPRAGAVQQQVGRGNPRVQGRVAPLDGLQGCREEPPPSGGAGDRTAAHLPEEVRGE